MKSHIISMRLTTLIAVEGLLSAMCHSAMSCGQCGDHKRSHLAPRRRLTEAVAACRSCIDVPMGITDKSEIAPATEAKAAYIQ
jgi:hypothetical protein